MQNFLKQKYVEELENYIEKEISNNLGIYIVRDGKKKIKHYSIFGEVDINLSRIKRNDTNIQIEKILESTSKFIRDFIIRLRLVGGLSYMKIQEIVEDTYNIKFSNSKIEMICNEILKTAEE